jgi:hypothetical protein
LFIKIVAGGIRAPDWRPTARDVDEKKGQQLKMATHTFGAQIHAPNEIAVDEFAVTGKKIVKLLAMSPETKAGPIMCGASGNMVYFTTYRSDSSEDRVIAKLIYKTKMPGTITAAAFHDSKFEVYLKIEKKTVYKDGKPVVEHEILAFDLETKKHSVAESKLIPKEPWKFPAAPLKVPFCAL